jgi:hypothetical protein
MRNGGHVSIIPHLMWNLPFDAKVFQVEPLPLEVGVIVAVAAILLLAFGPDLGARRSGRRADAA